MEPVVGIFPSRAAAQRAANEFRSLPPLGDRIELLVPGLDSIETVVPTEDAESTGVGQAVGGVVGAAAGASAGFGLGAVTASLLIPGLGAVTAVGIAAATLLTVLGAAGGAAAGGALEEHSRAGVPKDEIYLYEEALSRGRGILFAMVDTEAEAEQARRILAAAGAESLDAARDSWWAGIRDPRGAKDATAASDIPAMAYRRGFLAALQPGFEGRPYSEALTELRERVGLVALSEAFQKGYARGAAVAKVRADELGAEEPEPVEPGSGRRG